jgi:hypothetical protein
MADAAAEVVERSDKNSRAAAVASIAVYVDFDSGSDGRIRIAADWAANFGAALIGVAGWLPGREAGGWFEYGQHFMPLASLSVLSSKNLVKSCKSPTLVW